MQICLLMGTETSYVKSALFYMEKSVAEFAWVIELEQIPLVWLPFYFNKNISCLALGRELLLHGQSGCILVSHKFEATAF